MYFVFLFICVCNDAYARNSILLSFGLHKGGDLIAYHLGSEATHSQAGDATLNAGAGHSFELGFMFPNHSDAVFNTQFSVGTQSKSIFLVDGKIQFTRITFDLLETINLGNQVLIGFGGTYHYAPVLECTSPSIVGCGNAIGFDHSKGLVAQFMINPWKSDDSITSWLVGIRLTRINYYYGDILIRGKNIALKASLKVF
ncbi:MAG: hypothetical protein OEY38_13330 [Gammaproteobacteria bacterium]|nr:hypothetical protein [Gammaproteobacteria bacterium]